MPWLFARPHDDSAELDHDELEATMVASELVTHPSTAAGLATYVEEPAAWRVEPSARVGPFRLAAHALTHQWFGGLVTPAWWNDVWLHEWLAEWLARKVAAEVAPGLSGVDQVTQARDAGSGRRPARTSRPYPRRSITTSTSPSRSTAPVTAPVPSWA